MRPSAADLARSDKQRDEWAVWEAQLAAAQLISNPELREREEQYVRAKLAKLAKARREREREAQQLQEADTRRKQDDARLRGYQASGQYTHALPLRNAHEFHAEQMLEKDLLLAGEATGEAWVKTEDGCWARKHNPVAEQKSLLSENELSTQAYEAVDFGFGLRRSRSWDFVLAVHCVTVLLRKYCATAARSLQQAMYRDVRVTMKTFLRFPQAIAAVTPMLEECLAAFSAIRASRLALSMPVTVDDERIEQIRLWLAQINHEKLRRNGAKQAAAIAAARQLDGRAGRGLNGQGEEEPGEDDEARHNESGFANLPHEVLLRIFGMLVSVRDVVRVTAVCTRWYDAGNDDYLYRRLLAGKLSVEELTSRFEKVRSFKTIYMQMHSKTILPMTGLYLCSKCDELFWAGKNVAKHCQYDRQFERHVPGVVITPSTLVQGLLAAWGKHHSHIMPKK